MIQIDHQYRRDNLFDPWSLLALFYGQGTSHGVLYFRSEEMVHDKSHEFFHSIDIIASIVALTPYGSDPEVSIDPDMSLTGSLLHFYAMDVYLQHVWRVRHLKPR